jgi:GNAT superfamily N-acetyltransferase
VGEAYLWFGRLQLNEQQLEQIICDPLVEIYSVRYLNNDEGLLELDFRQSGKCELSYFGLTNTLIGKGVGRWLMNQAIDLAWTHPIDHFWVHTCTDDHPDALGFYIRSGFRPFKRQIEIYDDPKLNGILPRDDASHIPLL